MYMLKMSHYRLHGGLVEDECPFLVPVLKELEKDPNINIFSPFGTLISCSKIMRMRVKRIWLLLRYHWTSGLIFLT